MSLAKSPEVKLWKTVVAQAVIDAKANNISDQCGTERIYKWSRTYDCKQVCFYAQLDHDLVRIGFIKIYLEFLENEEKRIRKLMDSEEVYNPELHEQIIEIKHKKFEARLRWEKIKCQKL